MSEDKLFSPEFVFEICVGMAMHDFLCKDLPMAFVSQHYSSALSEHYRSISEEEISYPAEQILRFVSEQKNLNMRLMTKQIFYLQSIEI